MLRNLRIHIGALHMDAARYEDALAAFYQVELADAAAPQRDQAARQIVTCLERLGRARDARYALDQETALHKPAGRTSSPTIKASPPKNSAAPASRAMR